MQILHDCRRKCIGKQDHTVKLRKIGQFKDVVLTLIVIGIGKDAAVSDKVRNVDAVLRGIPMDSVQDRLLILFVDARGNDRNCKYGIRHEIHLYL